MVCDSLAAVLDTDLAEIKSDSLFSDMGFDSLVGVEFRNKVSDRTGLDLPAAMADDYPTPQALADHSQEVLGLPDAAAAPRLLRRRLLHQQEPSSGLGAFLEGQGF